MYYKLTIIEETEIWRHYFDHKTYS